MRCQQSTAGFSDSCLRLRSGAGHAPSVGCFPATCPGPGRRWSRVNAPRTSIAPRRGARTFPYTSQTNTVFDLRIVLRESFANGVPAHNRQPAGSGRAGVEA